MYIFQFTKLCVIGFILHLAQHAQFWLNLQVTFK